MISTRVLFLTILLAAAAAGWPERANAQVVNPADAQKPEAPAEQTPPKTHSWDMPPVDVYGKAPLTEEDLIGDYAQPRWTAARRFGETRVYVIPKGTVEFEYWLRPEVSKDGPTHSVNMYEVEFGLPGRLQLDLYAVGEKTGPDGTYAIDQQKVEVRYAFANWGKIWGNPTAYIEWTQNSGGYDQVEGKLLLGGELTSRWHWGSNFVFEHEVGGPQENSREWTTGLSYTPLDMKLGVGLETQLAFVDALQGNGSRGPASKEFYAGPSIQWRPLPQMHLDVAPLIGTTHDSLRTKWYVVLGYEF